MKLDRLISVLVVLLRRERVQAKELAEMFDVSVRTILRDVDAINLAGIPIVTYQGAKGGIGIAEGYRLDKSVLTGDDMAAVITALRGIANTTDSIKHEILMEKLKNTLTAPQLEALNTKLNHFIIDLRPWGESGPFKEKLAVLREAVEDSKLVEFEYTDWDGKKTGRRIEPYSLVLKSDNWYLFAWCCLRNDFRFFKLARMKNITALGMSFEPREIPENVATMYEKWQKPEKTVPLELLFSKEMENVAAECFGEGAAIYENGRLMVKLDIPENNWLYSFLLSFGPEMEVVRPPHIRKNMKEIAGKIYMKYSSET